MMPRYRSANLTPWPLVRTLLLCAIGAVLLLMLLFWWGTTVMIDRTIAQLAPLAEVTRGNVYVRMNGDIGVRDLTAHVHARAAGGTWRASAVTVHTPGLLWVVRTGLLGMSALPSQLGIDVDDLVVEGIETAAAPEIIGSVSAALFDHAGCQREALTPSDLSGFGIASAPARMRLAHRVATGDAVVWTVTVTRPGSAAWTAETELRLAGTRPDNPVTWLAAEFVRAEVRFDDDGFLAARNRVCAQRLQMSEAVFIDTHVERAAATLRYYGASVDQAFLDSYREYVQGGGRFTVSVRPRAGVTLAQLFSSGGAAASSLAISTTVREGVTLPVTVTFGAPDRSALTPDLAHNAAQHLASTAAPDAVAAQGGAAAGVTRTPASSRWRTIGYAELDALEGRRVQVVTRHGTRREGTLERYTAAGIALRLSGRDGGISLTLTPAEIRELRVAE